MAVTTPISVSELSWRPFFKRPKKLRQCGGNSTYGNVTLTPACPTKVLEPSACFSVNSVYGHPERNPPNISVSTAISAPYLTSKEANRLRPAFVAVQGKFLDLPGRLAICERVNLIQVKRAENSSETML
ncbi:hypothetical protein AVEN_184864-1 [Araneus ventricosus]|uniref:Uncharacterized protein n=1 Tax=Araneus ventricosus TaxID=182803 RepID=A0A4Y2I897_ARAVE|nr:hypothetical protein AVEN_250393-1 [Araneus ventricosus]GBM73991.1 hypothetical protein AVEN_170376-1 [Araneus ventricosus]GBM73992.1 hypothetical protein AVEN_184864-1 [Araneus ventricosus]